MKLRKKRPTFRCIYIFMLRQTRVSRGQTVYTVFAALVVPGFWIPAARTLGRRLLRRKYTRRRTECSVADQFSSLRRRNCNPNSEPSNSSVVFSAEVVVASLSNREFRVVNSAIFATLKNRTRTVQHRMKPECSATAKTRGPFTFVGLFYDR